jgi:hypothetical protein
VECTIALCAKVLVRFFERLAHRFIGDLLNVLEFNHVFSEQA